MKKKLAVAGLMILSMLIGFGLGVWITGRGYEKFVVDPARAQLASQTAIRANLLSLLRIGATDEAISTMEMMLDTETLSLTAVTNKPDELPGEVVRALKQVKTYRKIYPPDNQAVARVNEALANIPEITDHKKECQAGICRLIDLEKQKLGKK